MKKRWLSMVLILCLVLGLAPVSVVTSRAAGKTFEVTDEASFASAIGTESTTGNVDDPTIIKLKNDITLTTGYSINYYTDSGYFKGGNCSIRLDLCGHTLTVKARKFSTGAIMAGSKDSEDSRFELINSDKSNTGKVVCDNPSGSAGYLPFLFVTGNGEAIIGGKDSGNIEISGFNAGALQVGTSLSVGKLPSLTLNEGVTLVDNYAAAGSTSFKQGGGAVCVGQGTFIMNGGIIKNNEEKAGKGGGAVYVASGCSFTMNGGTIEGCTTNGKGGAVYGASGSTIILNNGTIDNCTATSQDSNGGGIFLAGNSTLTMNGGTLKNCHSSGFYGGGVYISSEASFAMHDGAVIDGCMAERSTGGKKNEGGGVYNTGTFTMDGGTIKNCTAVSKESRGGGVYVATGSSFTMSGGEITGNNAATGGGVGLWGGTFHMSGGTIKNNTASGDGNEISMLYGSADIDFNMTGGSVLHDTEGGGRSQIYVSGDNSSMKVSGGAQIDVGGSNYGFAGNGSVQIDSGYVKAVGKVKAYEYTPKVGNLIAAAGDIGAEKILDKITEEDYQKQAVIVATGTGNVFTVKFQNPSDVTADTPKSIRVIRGMHLTDLPTLKDQGSLYFGGWKKADGKLWTATDTVTADTTLESNWNSYSVDIRRQDDNTSVSSIAITVPFGYLESDGDQDLLIWNYGSPITASLEKESEVLDIKGIFVYGESGLVDSTSIGAYNSRGLYIGIKKDLSAGTYYSELVLNILGSEGTYKSRKVIPVTVVVEKATPNSVTAPRAEELAYGKTLQEASLNGGSVRNYKYINGQSVGHDDIPGTFTWAEPDKIPGVGDNQAFDVIFTPDDTDNYNIIRLQVPLNVKKATAADIPELQTFNGITYGQTLADIELTDGWSWADPTIKPEAGGSYEAYFTIDNENNYDLTGITDYADGRITRKIAVTVTKAVPAVTQWPTAEELSEGDALSKSTLTGGAADVPGTFAWTEPDTIPELGTKEYEVTFTPEDAKNYESVTGAVSVTVEDTEAPLIQGVTNGAVYCGAQTVTVSDRHLASVTVNGNTVTLDENGSFTVQPAEGTQTITAADESGNEFSLTITVNDGHTWGAWSSDGTTHTRTCTIPGCGASDSGACAGGEADCLNPAVCEICGHSYGTKNPENHKGTTVWVQTETEHTQKYTCCGAVTVETEAHEWENGICTECGYGCAHTGGKADCTKLAVCEICGQSYGDLDPENHTGEKEWIRTEKEHTQKYTCCGAVTVATEVHEWENGVCTECGYTCAHTGGKADCTTLAVCEICGESYGVLDPENHTGEKEWIRTEKEHTQKYTCCGAVTVATEVHEWENGVCTECGYTCAHTGGTADCTKPAVCEICGESYGDLDPANHSALRKIEAKAATRETEGNREYWYCEGCKKYFSDEKGAHEITLESTVIPRLPAEPETPAKPTEPAKPAEQPKTAQTTAPQTGDELPVSLFGILFAGSAAVLGSMVYKKKKRV